MKRTYTAFISYRHKPLDTQVAQRLHTMIERYRVPKGLRKDGRKHLGLVFRDRDELPLSNNLTEDIYKALDNSEFLIVVCTPDTPQSLWCRREIQYFISRHGRERILTVLAAGTPEESIPDLITTVYAEDGKTVLDYVEPLCAFLTDENEKKVLKNLKEEFLRLAAAILNCSFDALKQRQKRYRARKRAAIITAVAAVLVTIFTLLIQWNMDVSQKNQEISSLNAQILVQLRQSQLNESQALALLSESQLDGGLREDAIASALNGLEGDRPYYAPAEAALTDALHVYDGDKYYYAAKLQMDTHAELVILSRDGRYAVAKDANQNGTCLDLVTGQILWENIPISMDWQSSQITEDGTALLALDHNSVTTNDQHTGQVLHALEHTHADIQTLSSDAETLVIGYKPKHYLPQMTMEVIDVSTGEYRFSFQRETPYQDIVFSGNNRYCLLVPKDNEDTPAIVDCIKGKIWDVPLSGSMVTACAVQDVCFAFLTQSLQDNTYCYEIFSPEGILLRSLPAGSAFASQVQYLVADDQWLYAIRRDGGIQIVHQQGGVMFDDSFVDENVLLGTNSLRVEYDPLVFFDADGGLVVVNETNAIHRLYFSQADWRAASLGSLHYYEVPGIVSAQLCRADVYGETMEYQKAFINPNGSTSICLADKDDDASLIFLRYAPKQAEDLSSVVPGGCTEETVRAYLQQNYMTNRPTGLEYDTKTQTLSWTMPEGTQQTVESPLYVTNPYGGQTYCGNSGWIVAYSIERGDDPDSTRGFAAYNFRQKNWKWVDYPQEYESLSAACIGDRNPWLATASETGHVLHVADLETDTVLATVELHSGDISDMTFVCDDRFLLVTEMLEQAVILVDTSDWQVVGKYKTSLTQYTYAGEYAFAELSADGTRLYIGNLLALQKGFVIDTQSWTLLAQIPYMACYDKASDRILCMDPAAGKLIAYPAYTIQELIHMAKNNRQF